MHHLSRTNLSLDDLVKKNPSREKEHHLYHHIVKKKALNQNHLAELKVEICRIPRSKNGSPF